MVKQWLKFEQIDGPFEDRKNWIVCKTKKNRVELGEIYWNVKWKQYGYHPYGGMLLHSGCLTQLAEFLDKQTKKQKKRDRKAARGEEG